MRQASTVPVPSAPVKVNWPLRDSTLGVVQAVGCILKVTLTLLRGWTAVFRLHVSTRVAESKLGVLVSLGVERYVSALTPAGMLMVNVTLSRGYAGP